MGDWLDQVARAMARGASRKDFLKVVGAGLLGLVVGEASVAEAKKGGKGGKGGKKGDKNPCPTGLTKCPDGTCHDLTSDPSNCGACGNLCTEIDDICANGVCRCPGLGEIRCSGKCVSVVGSDNNNCGRCGNVCTPPETCSGGRCSCPIEGDRCADGLCHNFLTDPFACGGCPDKTGKVCGPGLTCSAGQCTQECPTPGQTKCPDKNGTCTNLLTDNKNCGACSLVCINGQSCQNGKCACNPATSKFCPDGQTCCALDGICAGPSTCCPKGSTICPDGVSCCPNGGNCCGEGCCDAGFTCCNGQGCCPAGQTCCPNFRGCCPAGSICGNTQCVRLAPPGTSPFSVDPTPFKPAPPRLSGPATAGGSAH